MIPDAPGAVAVLEGSEGRLEIINFIAPQIGCRMTATIRGETQVLPTDGPTTYEAQLDHVLDVLAGRAAQITGGADAIANMAAIDAIYRAAGRP
jgi:predicted dehydrogenase